MALDYGIYNGLVEEKKQILFRNAQSRLNPKQFQIVKLAFEVSSYAHVNQKRKSGEPYITHPLEVATIVTEWGLDEQTIAGAILHDVVEDTEVTKADLEQIFGPSIAELVDGVTKLEQLNFESAKIAHAEYFRKVVLAMAKDVRVILIKLADRLHNMLTLKAMRPDKRKRIALETMEIYAPIANKIGLHKVHIQLAEESFKYLYPFRYSVIAKAASHAQKKRLPIIEEILQNIGNSLKSNGITAQFIYRQRSIYNLYRRMQLGGQSFNRIYDVFEIKIVVKKIGDCYLTIGVLHSLYQPIPGTFKDYIAIPKSNGYQSLHSTLMGPHGTPLQLHIRTLTMDQVAENGIISHWLNRQNDDELLSANQRTNSWINNILDIQSSTFSADEFLDNLKQDLSPGDIYVFTPKGKIMLLPRGATVLDFAYFIHSDIGNHCHIAYVNQRMVKLDYKLNNGEIIEIVTKDSVEPSEEWLSLVVSGKAKSKIKQYFKEQKYDEDVSNGIRLLNLTMAIFEPDITVTDTMLDKLNMPNLSIEELKHMVGNGSLSALKIIKQILNYDEDTLLNIKLSQCVHIPIIQDESCLPLPGEKVLIKITRHGELLIHRLNCKIARKGGLDNLTYALIINDTTYKFATKIRVLMSNQTGTFAKLSSVIGNKGINIIELVQASDNDDIADVSATLSVKTLDEAEDLIRVLLTKEFVKTAILKFRE